MKIKVNPILKKEFKLGARSFKFPLGIALYVLAFSSVSLLILLFSTNWITNVLFESESYWSSISYGGLTTGFTALAIAQVVMICIIIPIITASSIAGERERQTLDILLTAPVSSFSIAAGKLAAALANVFMFVIGTLPALSLSFLYGGMDWHYLLVFIVDIMVMAFFVGAIGVWCSAVFKKTIASVIMTMLFELLFYLVPFFIYIGIYAVKYRKAVLAAASVSQGIKSVEMGWSGIVLIFDPFVTAINSLIASNSGAGVVNALTQRWFSLAKNADSFSIVINHWTMIGSIIAIVIGFIFLFFTARKIDAPGRIHGKAAKKNKKKA